MEKIELWILRASLLPPFPASLPPIYRDFSDFEEVQMFHPQMSLCDSSVGQSWIIAGDKCAVSSLLPAVSPGTK